MASITESLKATDEKVETTPEILASLNEVELAKENNDYASEKLAQQRLLLDIRTAAAKAQIKDAQTIAKLENDKADLAKKIADRQTEEGQWEKFRDAVAKGDMTGILVYGSRLFKDNLEQFRNLFGVDAVRARHNLEILMAAEDDDPTNDPWPHQEANAWAEFHDKIGSIDHLHRGGTFTDAERKEAYRIKHKLQPAPTAPKSRDLTDDEKALRTLQENKEAIVGIIGEENYNRVYAKKAAGFPGDPIDWLLYEGAITQSDWDVINDIRWKIRPEAQHPEKPDEKEPPPPDVYKPLSENFGPISLIATRLIDSVQGGETKDKIRRRGQLVSDVKKLITGDGGEFDATGKLTNPNVISPSTKMALTEKLLDNPNNRTYKQEYNDVVTQKEQLSKIRSIIQELDSHGIKTSITLSAKEAVANFQGETTHPRVAELKALITGNLQEYRKTMSGLAVTATEMKENIQIFPSIGKKFELNDALIKARFIVLDGALRSAVRAVGGQKWQEYYFEKRVQLMDFHDKKRAISDMVKALKDGITEAALLKGMRLGFWSGRYSDKLEEYSYDEKQYKRMLETAKREAGVK